VKEHCRRHDRHAESASASPDNDICTVDQPRGNPALCHDHTSEYEKWDCQKRKGVKRAKDLLRNRNKKVEGSKRYPDSDYTCTAKRNTNWRAKEQQAQKTKSDDCT